MKGAIFVALFLAGCSNAPATAPTDMGGDSAANEPSDGAAGAHESATYLLTLDAGAFPPTAAHPSALVYVPRSFDPTPPISIVVFLHGFSNCVENVVRDAGGECTAGGGTRAAYALAAQLEASGKNAILLCPEVLFDQSAGNPGTLGSANGFKALVTEVLADLNGALGGAGIGDVGTVVVASHSGGYQAAAAIANKGGVPVAELYLLDSLYGNAADFDTWAKAIGPGKRFADVYTSGGGTLANSQAMASRATAWIPAAQLLDDRTTATWSDADYVHQLLFKLSALSHDGVPAYYFGKLVGSSVLANKK